MAGVAIARLIWLGSVEVYRVFRRLPARLLFALLGLINISESEKSQQAVCREVVVLMEWRPKNELLVEPTIEFRAGRMRRQGRQIPSLVLSKSHFRLKSEGPKQMKG